MFSAEQSTVFYTLTPCTQSNLESIDVSIDNKVQRKSTQEQLAERNRDYTGME